MWLICLVSISHSRFDSKIIRFYFLFFYTSYFPSDGQNGTRSNKIESNGNKTNQPHTSPLNLNNNNFNLQFFHAFDYACENACFENV
jgi:hypothetical protein